VDIFGTETDEERRGGSGKRRKSGSDGKRGKR